ncbi:EamA family transporter [Actinomycetospora termitidis]|uniref:EamA family transporter n=1 Tax=Actinomycetospora termitidis TaxID=3053470 RepID=A0ABT7MAQ7_9PSEU|nr:EamA family transporter [Actinomycetospora sp. Odt1-22]MDL5156508.1 EamA family transporter [Actinomycetospora sp. Odt1-22]
MVSRSSTTNGLPAPLLFVLGGASMYVGAALAVGLFERVSPAGVAWLRLAGAAVVLGVWRLAARRWSRGERVRWSRRRVLLAGAFGLVTAGMNIVFYEAIARLPLGTAVAIEFAGPVLVAALGSRSRRDWAALALVVLGVGLIADVRLEGSPAGVAFALLAALLWAGYIVLGARVSSGSASTGEGIDGLAIGFVVAAVVLSPLALTAAPIAGEPLLLGSALALGVLSSVVPYVLDQVVLRRVGRARFALLLALLPLTATVVGLVGLAQIPAPLEAVGIAAVVVGVALRRESPAPD